MEIKISLLGTSYNNKDFEIKRCLDSILNQSFKNYEIILIFEPNLKKNNIIEQYKKKIKNLKVIYNNRKLGMVNSLNIGLTICKGKYISRIDLDDYYSRKKLFEQYKFMEKHSNISICGTKIIGFIDFKKKKIFKYSQNILKELFFFNPLAHSSVFIRRSFINKIKKYDSNFKASEDLEFWMRSIVNGGKIINLNKYLTFYNLKNKKKLRDKTNFYYNYICRKKYSKKIFGYVLGNINILIFYLLYNMHNSFSKIINKIMKW